MEIHIVRGEDQSGPYTVEQVQDYLAQGILLPDDLAWHDGLEDWIPLSQVMDSVATPAASPPPEPVAVIPEPIEPEPSTVEALEEAPEKAGGNKKLLIGIGAGVAVLAIAAAVWFFFIREKDSGTGNQQGDQKSQPKLTNNAPAPNPKEPTNSPPPPVLPPVTNTPPPTNTPTPSNPQPGTNVLPPLPPATNVPPSPPTTNAPPLPPTTNAPPPVDPGPDKPVGKLTAKEAAEVMAFDIGKWEAKGQGMPVRDEPHPIEMTMEASWKEEGKSVEYKFTVMEDGKLVNYFGHKEYDEAKGIFIYRQKWGGNPESNSHERYDAETQTYNAQSAPTKPPSESTSITVTKRIGKDKTQQTLRVLQNDRLVYSHEIISTRKAEKPATPKPAPPDPSEKKPGTVLWEFETGGRVYSSPAIGSDGTVYVGSSDSKLYALKTDSKGLAKSPWPIRGQNPQHTGRVAK